jgi:hypothetical protein
MAPVALFSALHSALINRTKDTWLVLCFYSAAIAEPITVRDADDAVASLSKRVSSSFLSRQSQSDNLVDTNVAVVTKNHLISRFSELAGAKVITQKILKSIFSVAPVSSEMMGT